MKKIMNFKVVDLVKLHEFYVFFLSLSDFFREHRRTTHHYINKRKEPESKQPHKHQTQARTHTPPVEEITIAPGKTQGD
jgi:hypothetical protein